MTFFSVSLLKFDFIWWDNLIDFPEYASKLSSGNSLRDVQLTL